MSIFKAIDSKKNIQELVIQSNINDDNLETIKKSIIESDQKYNFWFGELNFEKYLSLNELTKPENKDLEDIYLKYRFCKEIYISLLEPKDDNHVCAYNNYVYVGFNKFQTKTVNTDYSLETSYTFDKSVFKLNRGSEFYDFIINELNKTKDRLNSSEEIEHEPYIKFSKAYYNAVMEKLITDEDRHICTISQALSTDFTLMDLTSPLKEEIVINETVISYHPFYYMLKYFIMIDKNKKSNKPWWKRLFSFL